MDSREFGSEDKDNMNNTVNQLNFMDINRFLYPTAI